MINPIDETHDYVNELEGEIKTYDEYISNLKKKCEKVKEDASRRFDIIKSVEWCKWETTKETVYKCPSCGNYKQQGHMAGCRLKKEIDNARLCIDIEEA